MSVYVAETEIQILYADTDMMGVIYHGSYIKWLELGRRKLIEDIGYDYLAMEREGYLAPVHNVNITYAKPLKYSDRAFVRTWVEENTGMRTIYGFEIVNGDGEVAYSEFVAAALYDAVLEEGVLQVDPEMMRTDEANTFLGQRVNVWVSAAVFALGAFLYWRAGRSGEPSRARV